MGYPTCSRSLSLVQSSIFEKRRPLPSSKRKASNQAPEMFLEGPQGLTHSASLAPPSTLMAHAPCLETHRKTNCKLQAGVREIRNHPQGRPSVPTGSPRQAPGTICDAQTRTSIGASDEWWRGSRHLHHSEPNPRQSQGQHLLQDDRQSLLKTVQPSRPHPVLIQQAEGKEEQGR